MSSFFDGNFMEIIIFFSGVIFFYVIDNIVYSTKVKPLLKKEGRKTIYFDIGILEHISLCKKNNLPLTWVWIRVLLIISYIFLFVLYIVVI